jgi:hypothetical protein
VLPAFPSWGLRQCIDPEITSDMIAAEYQETLDDVLSNIEDGFRT